MAFVGPDDPVAKGAVTRCLDEISVMRDARDRLTALRSAIQALRGAQFRGLEDVFAEHLFRVIYRPEVVEALREYLRRYWFDEATGWWPTAQPVAPIYALGLLQALNVSLEAKGDPLPFDSYWIVGHHTVQLITLASPRQLTLLIATPTTPEPAPAGIAGESSAAWVTTRRAGSTPTEIDPLTGATISGSTELRERTYRIQSQRRREAR
jgi:hypothetical protein